MRKCLNDKSFPSEGRKYSGSGIAGSIAVFDDEPVLPVVPLLPASFGPHPTLHVTFCRPPRPLLNPCARPHEAVSPRARQPESPWHVVAGLAERTCGSSRTLLRQSSSPGW